MKLLRAFSLRQTLQATALACAALLCAAGASAQSAPYRFDAGLGAGMTGYIGEANNANPFAHPGFGADLTFRYIGDVRWSIRAALSTLGIKGDTADMDNVLPDGATYSFTSQIYGLNCRAEFNFFPYGIGEYYKRLRRWTPYLAAGFGVSMAVSDGRTYAAPTIPMAFGLRYKLNKRWNMAVEFSMTKAFSDHLDGEALADLNRIKTSFYKGTDWYSRISVGVSYEFGERCETCNYVD